MFLIISCKNDDKIILPEARFTTPIIEYGTVTFRNYSSNATEYLWEFDDGTTSTEKEPIHNYAQAGTYNVKLTASDGVNSDAYILLVAIGQVFPENLTQLEPLPFGRLAKTVSFTHNGKGYVGGGLLTDQFHFPNELWEFDPATKTWTLASQLWPERGGGFVFEIDDVFYTGLGEYSGNINNDTEKKKIYEYHPQNGNISFHSELPITLTQNYEHIEVSAAFAYDGKGYVIGKNPFDFNLNNNNNFREFTPDATTPWKVLGDTPTEGSFGMFHLQFDDKVIIAMGNANSFAQNQNSSEVWEYDIPNNIWTQKNDFSGNPRRNGISFMYNGEGYIGLGISTSSTTGLAEQNSDLWKYNVTNDSWEKVADLPIQNSNKMFYFVLGNSLYLGGGYSTGNQGLNSFYEYEF